jgi:hypothetical protein
VATQTVDPTTHPIGYDLGRFAAPSDKRSRDIVQGDSKADVGTPRSRRGSRSDPSGASDNPLDEVAAMTTDGSSITNGSARSGSDSQFAAMAVYPGNSSKR